MDTLSGLKTSASDYYNSWFNPEEEIVETEAAKVADKSAQEIVEKVELQEAQNTDAEGPTDIEETIKSPIAGDIVWPPGTIPVHQQVEDSDNTNSVEQNIQTNENEELTSAEEAQVGSCESACIQPSLITVKSQLEYASEQLAQDLEVAKIHLGKAKEMVQKIEDKAEEKEALGLITAFELTLANFEAALDEAKELEQTCSEEIQLKEEPVQEISQDV